MHFFTEPLNLTGTLFLTNSICWNPLSDFHCLLVTNVLSIKETFVQYALSFP